MLKALRRILAVVAILIALSVLVPLAYIEGTCRPASGTAASTAPAVALPPIDEPGYRRKLNTVLHLPEWYIVYSFEDFRPLPRSLQRKPFQLSRPYLRVLAELLHHQPRGACDGRIARGSEDHDLRDRHQLFRRIRHQGI
jgi:hypothetical protein